MSISNPARKTAFRRARRVAFTLVEVIIAIAILGAIVTAIYSVWTTVLRGTKVGLKAADEVQRERLARRTLEVALGGAQFWTENLAYYSFLADTSDEQFAYLSFVSRLPQDFPGSGVFPGLPVRRVTFEVEREGNGTPQFVLRQSLLLLESNAVDESYPMVLCTNVNSFLVEFWNTNAADWEVEWLNTNSLPPMVRVTLGFGSASPGTGPRREVTTVVSVTGTAVGREVHRPPPPQGAPGVPGTPSRAVPKR